MIPKIYVSENSIYAWYPGLHRLRMKHVLCTVHMICIKHSFSHDTQDLPRIYACMNCIYAKYALLHHYAYNLVYARCAWYGMHAQKFWNFWKFRNSFPNSDHFRSQNRSQICNLVFFTSELDSESPNALRKNIFKRVHGRFQLDPWLRDHVHLRFATKCQKRSEKLFRKFRNLPKVSESSVSFGIFRKFPKLSESSET